MEASLDLSSENIGSVPAPMTRGGNGGASPWEQAICSCCGALVTSCFTTPLDVIKVRLQAQQKSSPPSATASCFRFTRSGSMLESLCLCTQCTSHVYKVTRNIHPGASVNPQLVRGVRDVFVGLVQKEGISSLWSGLPATMLMAIPATIIYFTSYDWLKYWMGYMESDPSTIYIPILAGCLARTCAVSMISPLELIRTKMQSTRTSYRRLYRDVRMSVRSNGFFFMMRGLGPTLLRDVPFSAIYWLGYESTKSYYMRRYNAADPGIKVTFLSGAVCGTVAAALTLPFDVIKTHRQMELGEASSSVNRGRKLTSTWNLMSDLYRRKGITALYAGIIPRIVKVAPACAITITIYETGKSFFRRKREAGTSD